MAKKMDFGKHVDTFPNPKKLGAKQTGRKVWNAKAEAKPRKGISLNTK